MSVFLDQSLVIDILSLGAIGVDALPSPFPNFFFYVLQVVLRTIYDNNSSTKVLQRDRLPVKV